MDNRRTLTVILQVVAVTALLIIAFLLFYNRRPAPKDPRQVGEARNTVLLDKGWQFHKGDSSEVWEDVSIPHDWAIYGPFSRDNDLQTVAVVQNGEETATVKTGRTERGQGLCQRRGGNILALRLQLLPLRHHPLPDR